MKAGAVVVGSTSSLGRGGMRPLIGVVIVADRTVADT